MTRSALRIAHRWCGLIASLGVLWLALTGLPLFVSDALDLAHRPAPDWIVRSMYGVQVYAPVRLLRDGHSLLASGRQWLFDDVAINEAPGKPLALFAQQSQWIAIGSAGLVVLDRSGVVLDRVDYRALGLPSLAAVGFADDGALCLRAQDGGSRCSADAIDWRAPVKLPLVRWQEVDTRVLPFISWERLCADLHALRFLGQGATWLGVLVALAMSFLAISGTVVALSRPKKEHR